MVLQVWELPWRPTVLISGRSYYTVDPASGLITQHKDVWDAVDNNTYPSPEAVILLVQQVSTHPCRERLTPSGGRLSRVTSRFA
jgi:hypothetical protein